MIFVDIGKAADLEVIFAKALKELPRRLLIVITAWKERTFYDLYEYVLGEFVAIPHDTDSFVESGEVTGFRIWNSWLGLYEQKALKSVAKEGDWIKKMLSGVEGKVLSLDVPEDPEPSDLIDSTPEVHYAGRLDGSRAVSQKLEFLCHGGQEWLTSPASRTGIPRD